MIRRRVLVATFGSAGDLFPLVPVADELAGRGHDVAYALPRSLALYLRGTGRQVFAVGDGTEMRVLDDARIVSTRFGGWASWRRTATDYLAPALAGDLAALGLLVARWRPDVVVAANFAVAARVAAARHGIPVVEVGIYPQHTARLATAPGFALGLRRAVAAVAAPVGGKPADPSDREVTRLAWGVGGPAVLLHDPALAGPVPTGTEAVGYPYWDEGPTRPDDLRRAEGWLDCDDRPAVLVTLGSFLGAQPRAAWRQAVAAARGRGLRALLVGPHGRRGDPDLAAADDDVLTAGFVPLGRLAHRVAAVVHHGGLGTTFAALRAGRPAVVVPQAFDQPHNAAMVAAAGVGVDAGCRPVGEALATLLADDTIARRARQVADGLVPTAAAASRAADRVLAGCGDA